MTLADIEDYLRRVRECLTVTNDVEFIEALDAKLVRAIERVYWECHQYLTNLADVGERDAWDAPDDTGRGAELLMRALRMLKLLQRDVPAREHAVIERLLVEGRQLRETYEAASRLVGDGGSGATDDDLARQLGSWPR